MPPATPFPPPRARSASPARRSRRSLGTLVLSVALLAATALTGAPAALGHPLDPGPTAPVPRPAVRPPDSAATRPGGGGATHRPRPRDLASLRSEATRLRAKLEDQHRRLEVLAEDLEEAYARGVDLLADAARLDRRRRAAGQELATVQARLDERARSTYMAGPGWFVAAWSAPTTRPTPSTGYPSSGPCSRPTWPWSTRWRGPRPGSTTPARASRPA